MSKKLGRRLKFLIGKPGLDGHSNGAEQIAARARDAGMDVVYDGIRLTAEAIAAAAAEKNVHVVGLSILSGSHLPLVDDVMARLKEAGLDDVPVVVGGIIPKEDASALKERRRRRGLHAEGFRVEPHHGRRGAHRRNMASAYVGMMRHSSSTHHRRERFGERARADRLAQISVHAGTARGVLVAGFGAAGNADDRRYGRRCRRARGCGASVSRPSMPGSVTSISTAS